MHNDTIPESILNRYQRQNSIEVVDHGDCGIEVLKTQMLRFDGNLVRHDPARIKDVIERIL